MKSTRRYVRSVFALHTRKLCFCQERAASGFQTIQNKCTNNAVNTSVNSSPPQYDWKYLLSQDYTNEIEQNIHKRKGIGNINRLLRLWNDYKTELSLPEEICIRSLQHNHLFPEMEIDSILKLRTTLMAEASKIPNKTHPDTPVGEEHTARHLDFIGSKREFDFAVKSVIELGRNLNALRTENVGVTSGSRSYHFMADFARLQDALVSFAVDVLSEEGFELVVVPEIIHPSVIEGCGFRTSGLRHQVYHLYPQHAQEMCLIGTGEMPLAALFAGNTIPIEQLPIKLMTVSKCYRAEVADTKQDKGIYRVHQFTKVEMFAVTAQGRESNDMFKKEFLRIQKNMFSQLGLCFRILDMPSTELGSPAYCKYDMETWMPHLEFWGEISSTSHCTDYQSRRLNIRYLNSQANTPFVHTINGTACAVPRLIMAIAENRQTSDGKIVIPDILQPYMDKYIIEKPRSLHRILPIASTYKQ